MKKQINISKKLINNVFNEVLSKTNDGRGSFFIEMRKSAKDAIQDELINQGLDIKRKETIFSANLQKDILIKKDPMPGYDKNGLDVEFCSKYGFDDYSLSGINYINREYCQLPSLQSLYKIKEFSIGNFVFVTKEKNVDIELNLPDNIKIVGYSYNTSIRKRKPYFAMYGFRFNFNDIKKKYVNIISNCSCKKEDLDEVRIGIINFPIMFICRICGKLHTCQCFKGKFSISDDIVRLLPWGRDDPILKEVVSNIKIKKNICHLCTKKVPQLEYGHEMYYSSFLQKYLPYYKLYEKMDENNISADSRKLWKKIEEAENSIIELIVKKIKEGEELDLLKDENIDLPEAIIKGKRTEYLRLVESGSFAERYSFDNYVRSIMTYVNWEVKKEITILKEKEKNMFKRYNKAVKEHKEFINNNKKSLENKLRKNFDYPLIGEKWISETMLYKIVNILFADKNVVFHYRGSEINNLEIDVFLPELNLAIEYQGEQHYKPIKHWGGEEGLKERKKRDRLKKDLCRNAGYELIEFKYSEKLTPELVERKLKKYIKNEKSK